MRERLTSVNLKQMGYCPVLKAPIKESSLAWWELEWNYPHWRVFEWYNKMYMTKNTFMPWSVMGLPYIYSWNHLPQFFKNIHAIYLHLFGKGIPIGTDRKLCNQICMSNKSVNGSQKNVCLLLQGARRSWLPEGKIEYSITVRS